MADNNRHSRREFLKACGSVCAAVACGRAQGTDATVQRYAKTLIVDEHGEPVRCETLGERREYIFHYPYRATPCFLVDIGQRLEGVTGLTKEDGQRYDWSGGIGPNQSVVAFSAICPHKLTHPSKTVSFIGYRSEPVGYLNRNNEVEQRANVIQCCSERSIYDPTRGAAVISGPAPQPLAAIELRIEDGALYATGVRGGELFTRYFELFAQRLELEYLGDGFASLVGDQTIAIPGETFSRNRVRCG